ncbi:hypothetical protein [Mesomycoplasma flocculare]|nr:hypothetical protein [Mesomycoplasma flocculare]
MLAALLSQDKIITYSIYCLIFEVIFTFETWDLSNEPIQDY